MLHPAVRRIPGGRIVEASRGATLVALLFLATLFGPIASAATDDAQTRFAEGRAAFDAGEFSRALLLFEQCLALGMQGPAVHYNIGVAAYRSGDYPRAERAFRAAADTPAMAALAHYNLGLVALKRGDRRAARQWFERAAGGVGDERLAALAAQRLAELPRHQPAASWSWYARGGAGYDDNVALRSESVDGTGSGESDGFGDLLLSGSFTFRPGWRIDGAAGLLRYADLDEFDQDALSLGVVRAMALHGWSLELGGYGSRLSLGGDVYEQSFAAVAQATRSLAANQRLRAQLRVTTADGEADYSGLSGDRAELALRYDWNWRAWTFGAHTRGELNDTQDDVYTSRWVEFGAEARWAPAPLWNFTAGTTLRHTRYPAPDSELDSWTDRRAEYRLEAGRAVWKQAQISLRLAHERNSSPLEGRDYDRNWIAAAFEMWH